MALDVSCKRRDGGHQRMIRKSGHRFSEKIMRKQAS
jgi:hypothetical protein